MLNFNDLSEAVYEDLRFQTILQLESSGMPQRRPFLDSAGIPTIGIGFNLQVDFVQNAVFGKFGMVSSDDPFRQRLTAVINNPPDTTDELVAREEPAIA